MKLIIDEQAITPDSVRTHPNRIYSCGSCNRLCTRADVRKDSQGIFHCPRCDKPVEDVTDTAAGRSFAQVMGL